MSQTLDVQAEHVEILQRHLRSGKIEHRTARRSRILLLRSEGVGPSEVAQRLGCGRNTVWRIEERYRTEQLDALQDRPRPGRPRIFSPAAQNPDRGAGLP